MTTIPHLSFAGQCEEAFRLYAGCLRGEITLMLRHSEVAELASEAGMDERIVHAKLKLGSQTLTGADVPSGR